MKKKIYKIKNIEFNNLYEAMFHFGVSPDTFHKRRRKGETIEKALSRKRSNVGPKSKFNTKEDYMNRAHKILEKFASENKIKNTNDWYKQDQKVIGSKLGPLGKYPFTDFKDITDAIEWFTKETIYPWMFKVSKMGIWEDETNVFKYIKWLEKKIKIKKLSDWYKVDKKSFSNNYGGGLLVRIEKSSIYEILKNIYPDYKWIPWLFKNSHTGIWSDTKNHRQFLDWVIEKEKIDPKSDEIYNLNSSTITKYNGRYLMRKYDNFVDMIIANFPELNLNKFKFFHKGRGTWDNQENHKAALLFLGELLGFKNKNDWYGISVDDFEKNGLSGLYTLPKYNGSPAEVCRINLEEFNFDMTKFNYTSKFEFRARCFAKCFFGENNIIREPKLNYLRYKKSQRRVKLDIYIPRPNLSNKWKLAIEYNGRQHYFPSFGATKKEFQHLKSLDKEKYELCVKNKIKLIIIKYDQWDGSPQDFLKILKKKIGVSKENEKLFWERFKKDDLYKGIMLELSKYKK
jgi:hypothetical protein